MSSGQKTSWTESGGNEGKVESATASAPVCPTGTVVQSTVLFGFLLPNLSCLALWASIKYRVLRNVLESYSNSLQRNSTTEINTPNISLLFNPGYIPMTEIQEDVQHGTCSQGLWFQKNLILAILTLAFAM